MSDLWTKIRVVLGAIPTWAAAFTAILSVVSTQLVPLMPGDWQVRVGAWVAAALAAIAAVVKAVANVTPVPPQAQGLTLRPGRALTVEVSHPGGTSTIKTTG